MIVLGIDPGSRFTGYAVIEVKGKKLSYIASGVLRFDKVNDFNQRLSLIYKSIKELIDQYRPDEVSFESLIYVKSPTALIKLSQARGAMIAAITDTSIVYEYSPNSIKSTITGHGHADKEAVKKTLEMIFGKVNFKTHDESDALAIATCHGLSSKFGHKISSAKPTRRASSLKSAFKHLDK